MNNENKLTILQAFNAMRIFLEHHYEQTQSRDFAVLLSGLLFLEDGITSDPAAWNEWEKCFNQALEEGEKKKLKILYLYPEHFAHKPLYKKCIETLNAAILNWKDSHFMSEIFEKCYPLTPPYNIDWNAIEKKINVEEKKENILSSFHQLFSELPDTSVHILWNDASYPLLKANLKAVIEHMEDIRCLSSTAFIFNVEEGYVIELLNTGLITIGIVPKN